MFSGDSVERVCRFDDLSTVELIDTLFDERPYSIKLRLPMLFLILEQGS